MAAKSYYAWSDLYSGGETEERAMANRQYRTVVLSRNVTPRGEKVTQAGLKVSDEEWQALLDGGSVRAYPVPEEASDYVSPASAAVSRITKGGEIDMNTLLELSLQNPPVLNPPADEGATLPEGT